MMKKGVMYVVALMAVVGAVGAGVVGKINVKASKDFKENSVTAENNNEGQENSVIDTAERLLEEGASTEDVAFAYIGYQAEVCQEMAAESGEEVDIDSIIKEIDKKADEYLAETEVDNMRGLTRGGESDDKCNYGIDPNEYYDWGIFEFLNFQFPNSNFTLKDCIYDASDLIDDLGDMLGDSFAAWKSLNYKEKVLMIKYPSESVDAYVAKKEALEIAQEEFGSCEVGTKADAFKQALWALKLTKYMSEEKVVKFVEASVSTEKDNEIKEMTLNNCKKAMALRTYHTYNGKTIADLMTIGEMKEAVVGILTNDKETALYWVK